MEATSIDNMDRVEQHRYEKVCRYPRIVHMRQKKKVRETNRGFQMKDNQLINMNGNPMMEDPRGGVFTQEGGYISNRFAPLLYDEEKRYYVYNTQEYTEYPNQHF